MRERMPSFEAPPGPTKTPESSPRPQEGLRPSLADLTNLKHEADSVFTKTMIEAQREIGNLHYGLILQQFGKTGDSKILEQLFMLSPETKMRLLKTYEEKKLATKSMFNAQMAEAQEEIEASKEEKGRLESVFGPVPGEEELAEKTIIGLRPQGPRKGTS